MSIASFASKAAIHEALADRMVADVEIGALKIARLPLPAAERLRLFVVEKHKQTVATMLDQQKVHEMVSIALEEQWAVIERHLDRVTEHHRDGDQGRHRQRRVCRPRSRPGGAMLFRLGDFGLPSAGRGAVPGRSPNRATPEELAEFAIRALKA